MTCLGNALYRLFELRYSPPVAVLYVALDLERLIYGSGDVLLELGA